ncbi:MAG TPA: helix-turn-helix domain-containing protein [Gemmatimonadales bacterium]|nr:helix-turn-helix domain-containing protein [Gemmatimonadales bacterium]
MQSVSRVLLVMHPDEAFRDRVHKVGTARFRCWSVAGWDALRDAVRDAPPAAIVVLDPYMEMPGRRELSPKLRNLLWEFPSVTVLAAMSLKPDRFQDFHVLGEWGVTEVLDMDEENTLEAVEKRLRSAYGSPVQRLLDRSLPPYVSGRARSILASAAEIAAAGGQGRDLARSLHLSERTLLRWCERTDLPPPRRVMAWMRILFAADLLDDPGRTVLSVAHACGYVSDSSLRRAMQDFLGIPPTALREQGAFATASRMMVSELFELRRRGREARAEKAARAI